MQPIDLQTVFSQVDKIGKNQAMQREGQQIQDSLQQIQTQKKLEENVQSVNEAQEMGKEAETIKDQNGSGSQANKGGAKGQQKEETVEEEEQPEKIRDPALGRLIDISG